MSSILNGGVIFCVGIKSYGSGAKQWFSGWFPEFLGCNNDPSGINDFPSGLVTVSIKIRDGPTYEDDGLLIAGTLGFTVKKSKDVEYPIVCTNHTWSLLLPVDSPVGAKFKSSKPNTPKDPEDDCEPKCHGCGLKTNGSQFHKQCFSWYLYTDEGHNN